MNMTKEQQAAELFISALGREGEQRRSFLDRACEGDALLRGRVECLLAADDVDAAFLQPPEQRGADAAAESANVIEPGTIVGRYRTGRLIASGGMGMVYEAEQDHPQRTVALKVMKKGFAGTPGLRGRRGRGAALRRFEHEAQFLAALRHPGIAQVYDSGIYDDGGPGAGVPYFVMEYVPDARAITDYARMKSLGTRDRLNLFITVCDAVHHAHLKGVIHRDLKPGNILIDTSGRPKIIDFGVARATDSDIAVTTVQTDVGQLIGTLQYMSPEQIEADPHDLDMRSDVYSLGVVLYELLCGRPPYEVTSTRIYEAARIIREQPPVRPSAILRALRGDLETIVLKALQKDRRQRYQSAADLGQDIRRYLKNQPIMARPPSAMYQLRTFARRNKALVGGVVTTFAALLLGLVGITALYLRVEAQRETAESNEQRALAAEADAEQRAEELEKVVGFQARQLSAVDVPRMGQNIRQDLLHRVRESLERSVFPTESADAQSLLPPAEKTTEPAQPRELEQPADAAEPLDPPDTDEQFEDFADAIASVNFTSLALKTLDDNIFEQAMVAVEAEFADHPLIKAHLLQTLANSLQSVGLFERALPPQQEALAIRQRELGQEHPLTVRSLLELGKLFTELQRLGEAERSLREASDIQRQLFGDEHRATLEAINRLGVALHAQNRSAEAEQYFRTVLKGVQRDPVTAEDDPFVLTLCSNIGFALEGQRRFEEAETYHRAAMEARRRVYTDLDRKTLKSILQVGMSRRLAERPEQAEPYCREALAGYRLLLGNEHKETLYAVHQLGLVCRELGKLDEAIALAAEAVQSASRYLPRGDDQRHLAFYFLGYGRALAAAGRFEEAEPNLLEASSMLHSQFGPDHEFSTVALRHLIELYDLWHEIEPMAGHDKEAARWSVESRSDVRFGPLTSKISLGRRSGRNETLLVDARFERFERMLASVDFTSLALKALDENIFEHALTAAEEAFADQPLVKARLLQTLATTLRSLGLVEKAMQPQHEALAIRQRELGEDHSDTVRAKQDLAVLYVHASKPEDAESLILEVLEVRHRLYADDHSQMVRALDAAGFVVFHLRRYAEAETYFRQAIELGLQTLDENDDLTRRAMGNLALALTHLGRPDEAEEYFREVLEARRKHLGDDHTGTLWAKTHLGSLLSRMGMLAEAESLLDDAYRRYQHKLGDEHLRTLDALISLGTVLHRHGRLEDAEHHLRRYVESCRRTLGDDNSRTIHGINHHGIILRELGRLEEAERAGSDAVALGRRSLPPDHLSIPFFLLRHGQTLTELKRFEEAEERLVEAHSWFESHGGPEHPWTVEAAEALAGLNAARRVDADAANQIDPIE